MNFYSKLINAFTLAETLITLVVVGVVAALTVPSMIAKYHEQQTVTRVKKMYSIITQLIQQYQFDNSCTNKISDCFHDNSRMAIIKQLEKKLNYTHVVYSNGDLSNVTWIPTSAKHLDGSIMTENWAGVWNNGNVYGVNTYYALSDGSSLNVEIPDSYMKSGFVFIDTNGKKLSNQIGKDQFPIGIGAYINPKYENKVHPYFNEDSPGNNFWHGLCNIAEGNECNPDICTKNNCSPTAYVLKYNKLPPINW